MFCYFCGKENDDKNKFCKHCGKSLHPTKPDAIRSEGEQKKLEIAEDQSVSRKLLVTVIILLVMLLAALGLCLFVFIRSEADSPLEMFGGMSGKTEAEALADEIRNNTVNTEDEALIKEDDEEMADRARDPAEANETEVDTDKKMDDVLAEEKIVDRRSDSYKKEDAESADNEGEKGSEEEKDDSDGEEFHDTAGNAQKMLKVFSAEASSVLNATSKDHSTYVAGNVYDGNYKTAWVEGVEGNGEGQILKLYLDGVHKISKIKIFNGYLKTKRRYAINGRVTKAVIDYGNGYQQTVDLKTMNPPEVEIEFAATEMGETEIIPDSPCETDNIAITITEVQPGSKYTDTAISEIEVYE